MNENRSVKIWTKFYLEEIKVSIIMKSPYSYEKNFCRTFLKYLSQNVFSENSPTIFKILRRSENTKYKYTSILFLQYRRYCLHLF